MSSRAMCPLRAQSGHLLAQGDPILIITVSVAEVHERYVNVEPSSNICSSATSNENIKRVTVLFKRVGQR